MYLDSFRSARQTEPHIVKLTPVTLRGAGPLRSVAVVDVTLSASLATLCLLVPPSPLKGEALITARLTHSALSQGAAPPAFSFAMAALSDPIYTDPLLPAMAGRAALSDVASAPVAVLHVNTSLQETLPLSFKVITFPSGLSFPAKILLEYVPSSDVAYSRRFRLAGAGGDALPQLRDSLWFRQVVFARIYGFFEAQPHVRAAAFCEQMACLDDAAIAKLNAPQLLMRTLCTHIHDGTPLEALLTVDSHVYRTFLTAISANPARNALEAWRAVSDAVSPTVDSLWDGRHPKPYAPGTHVSPHVIATVASVRHIYAPLEHSVFPAEERDVGVDYFENVSSGNVPVYRQADAAPIVSAYVKPQAISFYYKLEGKFYVTPLKRQTECIESLEKRPVHPSVQFEAWWVPYARLDFNEKVGHERVSQVAYNAWKDAQPKPEPKAQPTRKPFVSPLFPQKKLVELPDPTNTPVEIAQLDSATAARLRALGAEAAAIEATYAAAVASTAPVASYVEAPQAQPETSQRVAPPANPVAPHKPKKDPKTPTPAPKSAKRAPVLYQPKTQVAAQPQPAGNAPAAPAPSASSAPVAGAVAPPAAALPTPPTPAAATTPPPPTSDNAPQEPMLIPAPVVFDPPLEFAPSPVPDHKPPSFDESLDTSSSFETAEQIEERIAGNRSETDDAPRPNSRAPPSFALPIDSQLDDSDSDSDEDEDPGDEYSPDPTEFNPERDTPADHPVSIQVLRGRFAHENMFAPLVSNYFVDRLFVLPVRKVLADVRTNTRFASLAGRVSDAIPKTSVRKKPERKKLRDDAEFSVDSVKTSGARAEYLAERKTRIEHAIKAKDVRALEAITSDAAAAGEGTILAYAARQLRNHLNRARPLHKVAFAGPTPSLFRAFEDPTLEVKEASPIFVAFLSNNVTSACPSGYARFASETLLLSGDIELNPGPTFAGLDRVSPVGSDDIKSFAGSSAARLDDLAIPPRVAESYVYDVDDTSEDAAWMSSAVYITEGRVTGGNGGIATRRSILRPFSGFGFRTACYADPQLGWAALHEGRSFRSANAVNMCVRDLVFSPQLANLFKGFSSAGSSAFGPYLNARVMQNHISDHIMAAFSRNGDALAPDNKYDLGHVNHKVWEMIMISLAGCSRTEQFCFNGAEHAGTIEQETIISQHPFGPDTGYYPATQNVPANGNTGQGFVLDASSTNSAMEGLHAFPIMNNGAVQLPAINALEALSSPNVGIVYQDFAFGDIHIWFWVTVISQSFLPLPRFDNVGPANCLLRPLNGAADVPERTSPTWCSAASLQDNGYLRVMVVANRPINIPGYGLVNPNAVFNLWGLVRGGYTAYSTDEILAYWSAFRSKKGIDAAEFDSLVYTALPHIFFAIPPPDRGGMFHNTTNGTNYTPRVMYDANITKSDDFDAYSVPSTGRYDIDFPRPLNCLHQEPNAGFYVQAGSLQVFNAPAHTLIRPTARAYGTQLLTHPLVSRASSEARRAPAIKPRTLARAMLCLAAKAEVAFTRIRSALALSNPNLTALYLSDYAVAQGVWLDAGGGPDSIAFQSLLSYSRYSALVAPGSTAIGARPSLDTVVSCVPAPFAAYLGITLPEAFALADPSTSTRFWTYPPDPTKFRLQTGANGEDLLPLPSNLIRDQEVMFGDNTRSVHRGYLTDAVATLSMIEGDLATGNYVTAYVSPNGSDSSFVTQAVTHSAPPLSYSRSALPLGVREHNAVVRYVFYVSCGSSISVAPPGGIRVNSALTFGTTDEDVTLAHLFVPNDPVTGSSEDTLYFNATSINPSTLGFRGTRETRNVELGYLDKLRNLSAPSVEDLPLSKEPASISKVAEDNSGTQLSDKELSSISELSLSPVRSIAFTFLDRSAVPDLRIAFGDAWPAIFSEYFLHSYEQSTYFKEYMAQLTGEFVSPVYSPESAIRARIEQGLAFARDQLPKPTLFKYAAGKAQDDITMPAVYATLSRLSWRRVSHDLFEAYPRLQRKFTALVFGVHQPFATLLALAYQLSRGARFVLDAVMRLPEPELLSATTEGLKAYFSAWKTLALKVGAPYLGYPGNDPDLMDLGILIGYTPRPDEFNDKPEDTVISFFTPKPKTTRYMRIYRDFVAAYVPQVLRATLHDGDRQYMKADHIDLWSLWSTSGSLFDTSNRSLSSQLKKNALPFVYSAVELARNFTQTATFAKLVAKPDEKGKFRRILAVNLASLFNFIYYKTRTAFMTQAQRSGTSMDSVAQLGKAHQRQNKLASGRAGFSIDFPNYDQQQSQEFEALIWQVAGDFAESIADHESAAQARVLRTTALNKFVKLVGFSEEQVQSLAPQFQTLSDAELAELSRAALVADISGYVIPVFWGMLSGLPSTTIANTIAGLGIWSVSLFRLLESGIPFLGLDLNVQAGDDLDTYSINPVSALGAYRLISSEFVMRDEDWMYRAGTSVFLKVLYKSDRLIGFVNRALIPFAQRSPSSALSHSPVSDISELNDLYKLLALRGADLAPLRKYYYRAVDAICKSYAIPTACSARHTPARFGGLGVLPIDYSRSLVRAARIRVPKRKPLEASPSDLLDRGAVALAKRAGRPDLSGAASKKLFAQASSGVVDYVRDPEARTAARAVWAGFNPLPEDFVRLRRPEPKALDLSTPLRALASRSEDLPRPPRMRYNALELSLLVEEVGTRAAIAQLKKAGDLPRLVSLYAHYSLQADLVTGTYPLPSGYPVSSMIAPYLSEWVARAVLVETRSVAKRCSADATYSYLAECIALTLADPATARVLAAYAA